MNIMPMPSIKARRTPPTNALPAIAGTPELMRIKYKIRISTFSFQNLILASMILSKQIVEQ